MALEDGAWKYRPYNWRENPVEAMTYIAAARRHLADYLDGKNAAHDSEVLNLAHVMACCAIVIDADEQGTLIDNRPPAGKSEEVLLRLQEQKQEWQRENRKQWSKDSKWPQ